MEVSETRASSKSVLASLRSKVKAALKRRSPASAVFFADKLMLLADRAYLISQQASKQPGAMAGWLIEWTDDWVDTDDDEKLFIESLFLDGQVRRALHFLRQTGYVRLAIDLEQQPQRYRQRERERSRYHQCSYMLEHGRKQSRDLWGIHMAAECLAAQSLWIEVLELVSEAGNVDGTPSTCVLDAFTQPDKVLIVAACWMPDAVG